MNAAAVRLALPLLAVAVLAGCVPTIWAKVDQQTRTAQTGAFAVDTPVGWMRLEAVKESYEAVHKGQRDNLKVDRVLVTRDGFNLQRIDIIRFPTDNAFPHLKKAYQDSMLPSEVAELLIADQKGMPGLENLDVVRNAPKTVAGRPGVEVHVRYKNPKGLSWERVTYAFGDKGGLYVFVFEAPTIHYYGLYREVFERVVSSFRIQAPAAAPKAA